MKNYCTSNIELFILPIKYQTLSFHHSAKYELRIEVLEKQYWKTNIFLQRAIFEEQNEEVIDRFGNIANVSGSIVKNKFYHTNKFHILYNDQIIRFKNGLRIKIECKDQEQLKIKFSLIKYYEKPQRIWCKNSKDNLQQKEVSFQQLFINLRGIERNSINNSCYRKIIFNRKQYISYLDLAYAFTNIAKFENPSKVIPQSINKVKNCFSIEKQYQQFIKNLYEREIKEKLKVYNKLKENLQEKIENYKRLRIESDIFNFQIFEREIIRKQIFNLDFIGNGVHSFQIIEQNIMNSQNQLKRNHLYQLQESDITFLESLSQYYECQIAYLQKEIIYQSKLIQMNLSYIFKRLIQVLFALRQYSSLIIYQMQVSRIKFFIDNVSSKQCGKSIRNNDYSAFNLSYNTLLLSVNNYTKSESKPPYLNISNQPTDKKGKTFILDSVVTIFVHGYKGNQYDLSKIKSYLNIMFGYNNFYSIRGLSTEQIVDENISKLASVAAQQINSYLHLNLKFTIVNIIGFSLGGIIARALIPQISDHHEKLNLLMTIASPHLGIRDIQNCLIRSGLCFMRNFCKVNSIRQLNNERNGKQQIFMLHLASKGSIQHFKWIILIGSPDDNYIPLYSSLVDYRGQDEKTKIIYNCLKEKMKHAIRCEVKLQYQQTFFQRILKRKSHIVFLEDDGFIKHLLMNFSYCFIYGKN